MNRFPLAPVLLLASVGASLVGLGTRWGIGLTSDSVAYIRMAEELSQGKLVLFTSLWPPGYPALIAAVGGSFGNYLPIRLLGIGLAGANIILFARLQFAVTSGSRFFTLAGTTLAALSLILLETHTAAWSEPLFLFLLFSAVLSLSIFLDNLNPESGALATTALAFLPLTRYVGVVFLLASWALVVHRCKRRYLPTVAIFLGSAVPIASLLVWNRINKGNPTGMGGWNPVWPGGDLQAAMEVVASWLIPGLDKFAVIPYQSQLCTAMAISWAAWLAYSFRRFPETLNSSMVRILVAYGCAYPGFLFLTIGLSRSDVELNQRMLCSLHFLTILLTIMFLQRYSAKLPWTRYLVVAWIVLYTAPVVYGTHFLYKYGRGYLGPNYRAPEIYARLRDMNPEKIRTNDGAAVKIWLNARIQGMSDNSSSPLLFYRVEHPLPPIQRAGFKRDLVPEEHLEQLIRETPLKLELKQGKVELYLPIQDK